MGKEVQQKVLINELTPEEIAAIEDRMRAGKYSTMGFLADDERLEEIIKADAACLKKHNITHQQIADRLESIMGQALRKRNVGAYYNEGAAGDLIEGKFSVSIMGYLGYQICPFRDGIPTCGKGNRDFEIYNTENEGDLQIPDLIVHLIRDHHFFEGGDYYRLDPEEAIKTLELKPGVDYTPNWASETIWRTTNSTPSVDENFIGSQKLIAEAEHQYDIAPGVKAYVQGKKGLFVNQEELIKFDEAVELDGVRVKFYGMDLRKGQQFVELATEKYIVP
jgi:hypothetical protein